MRQHSNRSKHSQHVHSSDIRGFRAAPLYEDARWRGDPLPRPREPEEAVVAGYRLAIVPGMLLSSCPVASSPVLAQLPMSPAAINFGSALASTLNVIVLRPRLPAESLCEATAV